MSVERQEELKALLRSALVEKELSEKSLAAMIAARFDAEDVKATDSLSERAFARLKEAADPARKRGESVGEVPGLRAEALGEVPDTRTNGHSSGLAALLNRRRRPAFALGFALMLTTLLVVLLSTRGPKQSVVKTTPPTHRLIPAPRTSPVVKLAPAKISVNSLRKQAPRFVRSKPANKPGSAPRPHYAQKPRKPFHGTHRDLVASKTEIGRVDSVVGWATFKLQGRDKGSPLKPGMALFANATIETGDSDGLVLSFRDGTILKLGFNTRLRIPSVPGGEPRPKRIYQDTGKLYAQVKHLGPKSTFSVETPAATAEALGTVFSLSVHGQSEAKPAETVLNVMQGRVRFFNGFGSVLSPTKTESSATTASAPSEPKRLLTYWTGSAQYVTRPLFEPVALDRAIFPEGIVGATAFPLPNGQLAFGDVAPGSPAARAGIEKFDQVSTFNGVPVKFEWEVNYVRNYGPGKTYQIVLKRAGRLISTSYTTESRYPPLPNLDPGFAKDLFNATLPMLSYHLYANTSLNCLRELGKRYRNPALFNNIAVAYEMKEQMGEAIRNYQSAVDLDPSAAKYRVNLGFALAQIGNFERAAEEFKVAGELDPNWLSPRLARSNFLVSAGRPEEALSTLQAAEAQFGHRTEITAGEPKALLALHRPVEARRAAQAAIDAGSYVWQRLLFIDEALGDYRAQLSDCRKSYEARQTSVIDALNLAGALGDFGRDSEADTLFRQCLRQRPEEFLCYHHYGEFLRSVGRLTEAEAMAREAVRRAPDTVVANLGLAEVLADLGRNQEAERYLRRALEIGSEDSHALWEVGTIRQRQGKTSEAVELYRTAISLTDPQSTSLARMYTDLGKLATRRGRPPEGEDALRKAAKLSPGDPLFLSEFAWFLAEHDRSRAEAVSLARRAAEMVPSSGRLANNLGWTLVKNGEFDAAIAELLKAIDLYGGHREGTIEATIHLAVAYEKKGDTKSALDQYRKALSLDPKRKDAKDAVKRLCGDR